MHGYILKKECSMYLTTDLLLSSKASIADVSSASLNVENYSFRVEGTFVIIFAYDKNKVQGGGLMGLQLYH